MFLREYYFEMELVVCCQMNVLVSTKRMQEIERKFEAELVNRASRVRASKPPVELPPRNQFISQGRSSACAGQWQCFNCFTFQCESLSNACLALCNL